MAGDIKHCSGCRDDFYNHDGHGFGGKGCWNLDSAQVVTRFRIHWWTAPTVPRAFTEVTTNSCHYATGRYAHYKQLPDSAVDPILLEKSTPKESR